MRGRDARKRRRQPRAADQHLQARARARSGSTRRRRPAAGAPSGRRTRTRCRACRARRARPASARGPTPSRRGSRRRASDNGCSLARDVGAVTRAVEGDAATRPRRRARARPRRVARWPSRRGSGRRSSRAARRGAQCRRGRRARLSPRPPRCRRSASRRRPQRDSRRGRDHDGHRGVVGGTHLDAVERPRRRTRRARRAACRRASGRSDCVSGSPKRQLNSSTRGPLSVSITPANSTPMNGESRRASSSSTGRWIESTSSCDVDVGRRRVRAHAARVRPLVAVEGALEVLRGRQRDGVHAVAEREHRDLGAFEQLLDHQRLAERGRGRQRCVELLLRAADEDAFPGREPVGLDHARRPRDRQRLRRRNAGRAHDVLGEALRAFDRRRRAARAEGRHAVPAQRVGDARDERRLRADRRRGRRRARARARAAPRRPRRAPGGSRAWRAIPGLPGAQCSSVRRGLRASFHASACSRPPDPTRSTFTPRV